MRKSFVILAAAIAFALSAGAETTQARDGVYRSVAIDTSRIAASGHRHLAGALKPMLAGELSKALGPRLGRSGGQITVRITGIRLPPNGGEDPTEGVIEDTLEGVVIVPGRAPIPIRVVLPPSSSGAWYTQGFDQRRVMSLIEAFAIWAAREV
jgi:hypothetical protein